jgi:ubiquinone/menaquinone biosynthesis C-methylase UbiE
MTEQYTLGYSDAAMRFLVRRKLETHGAFFIPHLSPGLRVLDCGCGPGSITFGIAARIGNGAVEGIDMDGPQIALAQQRAQESGVGNATFRQASVYELPYPDNSFDAIFSHALFEHLKDTVGAAKECLRVLKPGGVIGVATPDGEAFIVAPATPARRAAVQAYVDKQTANGGDPGTGRKLATILAQGGFASPRMHARFEVYDPIAAITEVMAVQYDRDGMPQHAQTMRDLEQDPMGMWAQAWVSCIARKPG